jgi:hypothetical protein
MSSLLGLPAVGYPRSPWSFTSRDITAITNGPRWILIWALPKLSASHSRSLFLTNFFCQSRHFSSWQTDYSSASRNLVGLSWKSWELTAASSKQQWPTTQPSSELRYSFLGLLMAGCPQPSTVIQWQLDLVGSITQIQTRCQRRSSHASPLLP